MTSHTVAPPAVRLALDPAICSMADIGTALAELAYLEAHQTKIQNRANAVCQRVMSEAEATLVVEVEGETLSIADRRRTLEAAVKDWCQEHRAEVLEGCGKSRIFTHAIIGWRMSQLKVAPLEGKAAKDVLDKIVAATGLTQKLLALLRRVKCLRWPLLLFIDLKPSLSISKIKEAVQRETLSEKALQRLGLRTIPPQDEIYIDLRPYEVVSETAAAA